ncbi:glycosyltransferase family 4 protein [Nocardioides mangrovicus]|uniref:glycosyltransferase family 4 protein n=1 Tax=Nocardioides mangrovicus TaxID=2478913 RepID=UPI001314E438|nr:glycosyltransferase family 4 protein [Nocardioides mangrovicus]
MRPPVTFLLADATGTGGLARAVIGTANRLGRHRPTRLAGLVHRGGAQGYTVDVPHEVVHTERRWSRQRGPSQLVPEDGLLSAESDRALRRWLGRLPPGILVTTRPSLHLAAATWAPPHVRLVGWDHKNFLTRYASGWLGDVLDRAVPATSAWVVLTHADAVDYRERLAPARVEVIRNALSWPPAEEPAPLEAPVLVAAGRLAKVKGFGRLVDAFAPVAAKHPDWQLLVHGEGERREAIQRRVDRLGLSDRVRLPGYTTDLRAALRGASAFAMTSRAEGFPMVLLEAMSQGLPLVAMDCPRGPGEIVDDGRNGLLLPDGDVDGFSRALLALVEDAGLRRRLGDRAWRDARRYEPAIVTAQWLDLLDSLS